MKKETRRNRPQRLEIRFRVWYLPCPDLCAPRCPVAKRDGMSGSVWRVSRFPRG